MSVMKANSAYVEAKMLHSARQAVVCNVKRRDTFNNLNAFLHFIPQVHHTASSTLFANAQDTTDIPSRTLSYYQGGDYMGVDLGCRSVLCGYHMRSGK